MNTDDKFQEIYEKYKSLILKVAFDMTRDFHLAQDICQETFLKLLGYQDYVDEKRVKYWLTVVAANKIRDHFRKGGKYTIVPTNLEDMYNIQEKENCIDAYLNQLGMQELQNRMLEGLRKKNSDWYEVFILVEYLEVPRKQIAKQRNIGLSTVDSYLRRSREWLKSHYYEEYKNLK